MHYIINKLKIHFKMVKLVIPVTGEHIVINMSLKNKY